MSYSKFAIQAAREAELLKKAVKPVVRIEDVSVGPIYGEGSPRVAAGRPIDHPRQHLNGQCIHTSRVLKEDGDTIETQNTIYKVVSWHKPVH